MIILLAILMHAVVLWWFVVRAERRLPPGSRSFRSLSYGERMRYGLPIGLVVTWSLPVAGLASRFLDTDRPVPGGLMATLFCGCLAVNAALARGLVGRLRPDA